MHMDICIYLLFNSQPHCLSSSLLSFIWQAVPSMTNLLVSSCLKELHLLWSHPRALLPLAANFCELPSTGFPSKTDKLTCRVWACRVHLPKLLLWNIHTCFWPSAWSVITAWAAFLEQIPFPVSTNYMSTGNKLLLPNSLTAVCTQQMQFGQRAWAYWLFSPTLCPVTDKGWW